MRERVLLRVSVVLNVSLLVALWWAHWVPPEPDSSAFPTATNAIFPPTVRTQTVVRRLNFVWNQIESEDYATFIANLRLIGCPESTIRDIIVADVNQMFAKRRATEVTTPAQQWWKTDPDPAIARAATEKLRALDQERRSLLRQLLGPDWESADYPYPAPYAAIPLDGVVLGGLSPQVRAAVQQIERNAADRLQAYLDAAQRDGKTPDPFEVARLRQETRQELARLLNPEQLEEYLLRYAASATQLRSNLRGLDLSPEEFRALFHSLDPLQQPLLAAAADTSPEGTRRRETLEKQQEEALKQVLGDERYQQYKLQRDPLYRQALSVIEQSGVAQDKLVPVAAIMRLTQEEEQRIRGEDGLTPEERLDRLQAARVAQRESLRRLLGSEAFERFLENQPRLWENPLQ